MDPLHVIIWICVAVFALTVIITFLNVLGIYSLPNKKHGETLFKILIVEIVIIAVAAFGTFMQKQAGLTDSDSILEQIIPEAEEISTGENDLSFTPGKITDNKTIEKILQFAPEEPTTFSGKNFINREAGFLLTVDNPDSWQINYNPVGMTNSNFAINTFTAFDGSYLTVSMQNIPAHTTIEQYVQNTSLYMPIQPSVTYDLPSQTAFLTYTNPATTGESYMKIVVSNKSSKAYAAIANYNYSLSSPQTIQQLASMVGSFTIIDDD